MKFRDLAIGEIEQAMKQQRLSMLALSKKAGVSYDIVRDLLRGKTQMTSAENLSLIRFALGLASDAGAIGVPYYEEEEEEIPVWDSIAVAAGIEKILYENWRPDKTIPYRRKGNRNLHAVPVEGRSMDRFALPGQFAIVDTGITDPKELNGKMVIACLRDGCTFKRLKITATGQILLVPESTLTEYSIRAISEYEEFRIVGKVIDVISNRDHFR